MAGALSCICAAFSFSVSFDTMSAARLSIGCDGSRKTWAAAAEPSAAAINRATARTIAPLLSPAWLIDADGWQSRKQSGADERVLARRRAAVGKQRHHHPRRLQRIMLRERRR